MEQKEVGVFINNPAKPIYYKTDGKEIKKNTFVVVETSRGIELGQVVTNARDVKESQSSIMRIATKEDINKNIENKKRIPKYISKTKEYIKKLHLDMKVIIAELTLDANKIIITFTAENRVDFRELVKLLAGDFRMKIELRQIGSRDEVQLMGGVGICGRTCCCCKKPTDFEHVSIKMAKAQNLSLNPNNISGLCGKLLCCLSYENNEYVETLKLMPRVNSDVITPKGKGRVLFNNILKKTVQVRIDDDLHEFELDEIKVDIDKDKQN